MAKLIFFVLIILFVDTQISLSFKHKLISMLSEIDQSNYTPKKFNITNSLVLYNLYDKFQNYFGQKSSKDSDMRKCWDSIFNNMVGDYNYSILYFNSGHKLTEIGDSMTCVDGNNIYLLTLLTYQLNESSFKIEDKISLFTSKNKYNLGICIWKECVNFINTNIINDMNQDLKNNLDKIYHIKDIKAIWNYQELRESKNTKSFGITIIGIILMIYLLIYIILRIIVSVNSRNKSRNRREAYEMRAKRKKRIDYLRLEDTEVIKEEENEDDNNDNEEEEEKDKKDKNNNSRKNTDSIIKPKEKLDEIKDKDDEEESEEKEEDEEEEEENDDNDDSKISNDSLFKKEIEQTKIRYIENNLNILVNNGNLGDLDYDLEEKYDKKINILKDDESTKNKKSNFKDKFNNFNTSFLSLIQIKTLTEFKNCIYSNQGLEMITGMRTVALILMTLNLNFVLFEESPAIKQMNEQFIYGFSFSWAKLSSFGIYFWIYLDGFVYTFKLMNYVKKEKNLSFNTFLKFMINLIPKIFQFLMIFYGVYYFQKDIGKLTVKNSVLFEQYINNDYNYKCFKNILYLFFPFINSNDSENTINSNNFNNCYEFSYLVINEFYCIITFVIMFFILYKYKSKLLDTIISIIILFSILLMNFLPYLFENLKNQKYYLLKYVLGETFSIRYPLNMLNIFFIGVFSGLIYYYYYYSIKDSKLLDEPYLPMQYLTKIMQFLFKCNWIIKLFFILLSLGIIIVDCFIYYMVQSNDKKSRVLYSFSPILKILYLYEMPFIIFSISILLLFLLLAEDKFQIKEFFGSKMFFIMEKISFSYVCLIQMMSLLFISSSNNNDEAWSFLFFFDITCFEFAICSFTSFIFTFIFELPVKVLANILRGKDMKNKNSLIY